MQAIFTDVLGMKRAAAKIVSKLPNFKQKQHCIDIVQEILTTFNDDPGHMLKKVTTDDESWVYGYDIEIKSFCYDWGDKRKIETVAVDKKRVSEVFRGLEKTLA